MSAEGERGIWRKLTREILEQVPVGIILVDDQMRVRFLNKTTERFALASGLNLNGEELLGRDFGELSPKSWSEPVRRCMKNGKRYEAQEATPIQKGSDLLLQLTVSPILPSDGEKAIAAVITLLDVSEAEHRMAQMAKDARRFDHVWTSSCELMILVDERGRIVDYNMAAEETLGFFKEQVLGNSLEDYIDVAKDAQFLSKTIEEGGYVSNFETQLLKRGGGTLDVNLTLASMPKNERGEETGTLAIGRDMSKVARLKNELEELTGEIGDVQRDLNGSRSGVIDGLSLLMEKIDGNVYDRSQQIVRVARALALFEGMDDEAVQMIEEAALLSELGRIVYGVSPEEEHAESASELILTFGLAKPIVEAVRHHEEWYDGSGAPDGLEEELIPLGARVLAVAEALVSSRELGNPTEKALESLDAVKGVRLDPKLVEHLIELYRMDELL